MLYKLLCVVLSSVVSVILFICFTISGVLGSVKSRLPDLCYETIDINRMTKKVMFEVCVLTNTLIEIGIVQVGLMVGSVEIG